MADLLEELTARDPHFFLSQELRRRGVRGLSYCAVHNVIRAGLYTVHPPVGEGGWRVVRVANREESWEFGAVEALAAYLLMLPAQARGPGCTGVCR